MGVGGGEGVEKGGVGVGFDCVMQAWQRTSLAGSGAAQAAMAAQAAGALTRPPASNTATPCSPAADASEFVDKDLQGDGGGRQLVRQAAAPTGGAPRRVTM